VRTLWLTCPRCGQNLGRVRAGERQLEVHPAGSGRVAGWAPPPFDLDKVQRVLAGQGAPEETAEVVREVLEVGGDGGVETFTFDHDPAKGRGCAFRSTKSIEWVDRVWREEVGHSARARHRSLTDDPPRPDGQLENPRTVDLAPSRVQLPPLEAPTRRREVTPEESPRW
jgi:hypothetical protein